MKTTANTCALGAAALFFVSGMAISAAEPAQAKAPLTADVLASSKPGDWRLLDPENTLYVELATGRVVIELAPAFAPKHVANVKALAREHYFDGLPLVRAQDNYVAMWADPNAEKPELARKISHAQKTLPPEFERDLDPEAALHPPAGRRCLCARGRFFRRLSRGARPAQRQDVAGA